METEPKSSPFTAAGAASIPRRIAALGERYLSVATAVALLQKVSDEPFDERPFERLGPRIEEHLAELRRLKPGSSGTPPGLDALGARLAEAEALLLQRDAALNPAALDALVESAASGPEDALRYAAFLARTFSGEPERADKIGRMLLRALAFEERGVRKLRPLHLAGPALDYVIGGTSRASPTVRASAVSFFHGAMKRVESFQDIDALFSSGFVLDLRGYRTALRETFLDPEILYASVELELALLTRLFNLAEKSRRSRVTVLARLAEEARKADRVLGTSDLDHEPRTGDVAEKRGEGASKKEVPAKRETAKKEVASKKEGGSKREATAQRDDRSKNAAVAKTDLATRVLVRADFQKMDRVPRVGRSLAFGVLFVLSLVGLRGLGSSQVQVPISPVPVEELAAISEHIDAGALSGRQGDTMFVGAIGPTWGRLSADAKRKEAERIAAKLRGKNVRDAVVSAGETTVIRVSRGKVILPQ